MLGNIQFLAYKVSKETGIPKEWLEEAYSQYWDVVRERLNYSEAGGIYLPYLGTFYVMNSELRGYIRRCIKSIRYGREQRKKEDITPESTKNWLKFEAERIKRLRAAWKQLEGIRRVFIYNVKKTAIRKAKWAKVNEKNKRISEIDTKGII